MSLPINTTSVSVQNYSYTCDLFLRFYATGNVPESTDDNAWHQINSANTFSLFKIAQSESVYYINLSKNSLQSIHNSGSTYTFNAVERDGSTATIVNTTSDLFTIKKVTIKLNESVSKYVRLLSIGVNTNTAVSTSGHAWSDFILKKVSDNVYTADVTANINASQAAVDKFRLYLDCIPVPYNTTVDDDGETLVTGGMDQITIFNSLRQTIFASIQYSGNYVSTNDTTDNVNRLESTGGTYQVAIQEYAKLITIFEDDIVGTTHQYSTISINDVKYSSFRKIGVVAGELGVYLMRKYLLGNGELFNVMIRGDTGGEGGTGGVFIPYLKIKSGEFVSYVRTNDGTNPTSSASIATETVHAFVLTVEDSEKFKLPNKYSNIVQVYHFTSPTEDYAGMTVYYSNPLKGIYP